MRYSREQRFTQLRNFCWEIIHGQTELQIDGMFTVAMYAERVKVTRVHARRLLKEASRYGVIEMNYIEGHNGIDKMLIDPNTVDIEQFPF